MTKRDEFVKKIADCEYIINTTKSWKCKQDHIKCLKKLKKELNEYDMMRTGYYANKYIFNLDEGV